MAAALAGDDHGHAAPGAGSEGRGSERRVDLGEVEGRSPRGSRWGILIPAATGLARWSGGDGAL